jgi:hypothetical protein
MIFAGFEISMDHSSGMRECDGIADFLESVKQGGQRPGSNDFSFALPKPSSTSRSVTPSTSFIV